jgi:hypothetical protein
MTMFNRKMLVMACAVLVMGLVAVPTSQARDASTKVNYLTFSGPVALPGVVLPAGAYVFEIPDAHLDIVRITTRDRSRVLFTGFTNMVSRPAGLPRNSVVTFGEVPSGRVQPISAWFPLGDLTGREFIYR